MAEEQAKNTNTNTNLNVNNRGAEITLYWYRRILSLSLSLSLSLALEKKDIYYTYIIQARSLPLAPHPLAPRRPPSILHAQDVQTHSGPPGASAPQRRPPARQIAHCDHSTTITTTTITPRARRVGGYHRVPLSSFRRGSRGLVPKRYNREEAENQDQDQLLLVGERETDAWLRYRYYMHYTEGSLMNLLMVAYLVTCG